MLLGELLVREGRPEVGVPTWGLQANVRDGAFGQLARKPLRAAYQLQYLDGFGSLATGMRGAAFYRDESVKVGGAWRITSTGYKRTFEEGQSRGDARGLRLTAGLGPQR